MESLQHLAVQLGVQLLPPATADDIHAFEAKARFQLTDSLRELYLTSNGLIYRPGLLEINSLARALTYIEGMRQYGIPQIRNYFPVTENNDSNSFCVCCDKVMSGYVVAVYHDDVAGVKFRSLDDFFAAVGLFVTPDEWDLHELPSDMDKPERTPTDIEIGRKLLEQAKQFDGVDRNDTLRFGMCLLSEQQVDEIAPYLEDEDYFVSRDAKERLIAIGTPDAQRALATFEESMQRFVTQCADALKRAGMTPTDIQDACIRLDPGPVWLDIPAFYAIRKRESNIFDYVVERAKFFLKDKQNKDQG